MTYFDLFYVIALLTIVVGASVIVATLASVMVGIGAGMVLGGCALLVTLVVAHDETS